MSWGPLRLRTASEGITFDGEASPAPGGGAMPIQALYGGNPVNIGNGGFAALTFDTLMDGVELLDRSAPDAPTVLAAGFYLLIAQANGDALTAGGVAALDASMPTPNQQCQVWQATTAPPLGWSSVSAAIVAAGQTIQVLVDNEDGAAARNFRLSQTILTKLF